jgi:hypothetical protein
MLATPTSPATVIAGENLGRVLIACVQALVIILGSAFLFGVNWGSPVGVAAVVIVFALVASGAGILVGTLFRNEQQARGVSLLLGMGLGALGGCMVPLEVFSPAMRRVAHLTPQAWGNDAFAKLVGHGVYCRHRAATRDPGRLRRGPSDPGRLAAALRPVQLTETCFTACHSAMRVFTVRRARGGLSRAPLPVDPGRCRCRSSGDAGPAPSRRIRTCPALTETN